MDGFIHQSTGYSIFVLIKNVKHSLGGIIRLMFPGTSGKHLSVGMGCMVSIYMGKELLYMVLGGKRIEQNCLEPSFSSIDG